MDERTRVSPLWDHLRQHASSKYWRRHSWISYGLRSPTCFSGLWTIRPPLKLHGNSMGSQDVRGGSSILIWRDQGWYVLPWAQRSFCIGEWTCRSGCASCRCERPVLRFAVRSSSWIVTWDTCHTWYKWWQYESTWQWNTWLAGGTRQWWMTQVIARQAIPSFKTPRQVASCSPRLAGGKAWRRPMFWYVLGVGFWVDLLGWVICFFWGYPPWNHKYMCLYPTRNVWLKTRPEKFRES